MSSVKSIDKCKKKVVKKQIKKKKIVNKPNVEVKVDLKDIFYNQRLNPQVINEDEKEHLNSV